MKKISFFDLDKTIYNTHSFFQLAEYEIKKGRVTTETWNQIQLCLEEYKKGNSTYADTAQKLLELFAMDLKGEKYTDLYLDSVAFFDEHANDFFAYFGNILPKLLNTHDVYLVTTNAQYVAEAIVNKFALQGYISSEFEVTQDLFTGKLLKSLATGKSVVQELIAKYGKIGSIAVGDSENDIGMLELVEFPICINANEALTKYASEKNWPLTSPETIENIFSTILTV